MAESTPSWGGEPGEGRPHEWDGPQGVVPGTNTAGQGSFGGNPPQAGGGHSLPGGPGGPLQHNPSPPGVPPGNPQNWFPPHAPQPGPPGQPGQPPHPVVPGTNTGGQGGVSGAAPVQPQNQPFLPGQHQMSPGGAGSTGAMSPGAIPAAQSVPGIVPQTSTAGQGSFGGNPPQRGVVPPTNTGGQGSFGGNPPQQSPGGNSHTGGASPGGGYTGYGSGAPPSGPISTNPLKPNPNEIAGLGPANIQQFGGTPNVDPTYAQAASINPNSAQSYLNQYGSMLQKGMAPEFQQQRAALAQADAARGLSHSGSGAELETNLMGQQAGAYANAYAPMVSQAFGYQQQDLTGNAGYKQQANLANQQASNDANVLNANFYNQDRYTNAGAYNQFQNELFGQGASLYGSDTSAYLNSFGPSTGVTNAMNSALQGQQSAYASVYGQASAAQAQQEQAAMMAAAAGG